MSLNAQLAFVTVFLLHIGCICSLPNRQPRENEGGEQLNVATPASAESAAKSGATR